jgi:hypothetical protein
MNEQYHFFDFTYLHKHHVALSSSENQKAADVFKRRFSKKSMDHPP